MGGGPAAVDRSPLSGQMDAAASAASAAAATSETFAIDLRKEVALQELMCAVVDLDEMLPANFMKSHFNALYAFADAIRYQFVTF